MVFLLLIVICDSLIIYTKTESGQWGRTLENGSWTNETKDTRSKTQTILPFVTQSVVCKICNYKNHIILS